MNTEINSGAKGLSLVGQCTPGMQYMRNASYLGEWSKTCCYYEGRAAANLAKLL